MTISKKLLILDVDETLVHATQRIISTEPDFVVLNKYNVYKRPHLNNFLDYCIRNFELAIWSTGTKDYIEEITGNIFRNYSILKFVWSRDRCLYKYDPESQERYFVKPLKKVRRLGYNLGNVLMVDDTPANLQLNYGNLIPIDPFLGDRNDNLLLGLINFLDKLIVMENVRSIEKRNWQKIHEKTK